MLLYSKTASPRLQYLAQFLGSYFSTEIALTSDVAGFREHRGTRINYSAEAITEQEFHIAPVALLFSRGVEPVSVDVFEHPKGYKALFPTHCTAGFDLLAAIFYLVSRYEEYGTHEKDSYGRYPHTASLAFREGFLHLPLVNIWLQHFGEQVSALFPQATLAAPPYRFIPTYDIDIAWSYRNKGFVRNAGGFVRSLIKGQWKEMGERALVLLERKEDPYDSYEWMDSIHKAYDLHPIYFFHVGLAPHQFDKNIKVHNKPFQELIRRTAGRYSVGLHPSWRSGIVSEVLKKEKDFLEGVTGSEIVISRQHYIRLHLPQTYEHLAAAGIREDYSMGYGSINGFRASIASPFHFYNLAREEATTLLVHPSCFMEANAFFEQRLTAEEALQELLHYHHEIKKVGGNMITIWHNTFLGTDPLYRGWRELYQKALETISTS